MVRTVAPQGVDASATSRMNHPANTYVTSYEYNSLMQLVKQTTPDAGTTLFWYNVKGQLRFSKNAKQTANGTYSYTKYALSVKNWTS